MIVCDYCGKRIGDRQTPATLTLPSGRYDYHADQDRQNGDCWGMVVIAPTTGERPAKLQ